MEKNKEDKVIFDSFLQRFKYNSQPFHIILYSTPKGFEYNIETGKVRPLNSILWYSANKKHEYELFIEHLNSYCEGQFEVFEKDYFSNTSDCTKNYNGNMSIDLNVLGKKIMTSKNTKKNKDLIDSFTAFKDYLEYLYSRNEDLLRYIVDIQEDLL